MNEAKLLSIHTESIPHELQQRDQWVCFKLVWNEVDQKYKKIPISAFFHPCNKQGHPSKNCNCTSSTDPSLWASFDDSLNAIQQSGYDAIGYALAKDDPYTGIDLDKVRDPDTGIVEVSALQIAAKLNSYSEVSISGTGIHTIIKADLPKAFTRPFEVYSKDRFFIFTGNHMPDFPTSIEPRQPEIDAIIREYFGADQHSKSKGNGHDQARFWRGEVPHGSRHESIRNQIYKWRMQGVPKEKVLELAYDAAKVLGKKDKSEINRMVAGAFEKPFTLYSAEDITDLRNSARFAERFGESFLYSHPEKKWYTWTGTHHAPDQQGIVIQSAKEYFQELLESSLSISDEETKRKVRQKIVQFESENRIRAMITLAQSNLPIIPENFDSHKFLFNCSNCTIDLEPAEPYARQHSRLDFISKISPVKFDPAAECPRFVSFLNEIFKKKDPHSDQDSEPDQELILSLQKFFGLTLTGETEQLFLIFHGNGDNGKTTLIEIMRYILGDYAVSLPQQSLLLRKYDEGVRNDLAMLKAARFASCMESGLDRRLDEPLIKQLTGQDTITCRFLHKEFFSFTPECKIVLGTNHQPKINSNSYSIWKRVKLIPFNVVIPKADQDTKLSEKLRAESSGILNWMIEGYQQWRDEGLQFPESVQTATDAYKSEMDLLSDFISECCDELPKLTVKAGTLYNEYQQWCIRMGAELLNQTLFGNQITERGVIKQKDKHGVHYKGIGLKAVSTEER